MKKRSLTLYCSPNPNPTGYESAIVPPWPFFREGGIHTQIATLNIIITLGGRGFAALTLHVWQNDTFPKFVISFLT